MFKMKPEDMLFILILIIFYIFMYEINLYSYTTCISMLNEVYNMSSFMMMMYSLLKKIYVWDGEDKTLIFYCLFMPSFNWAGYEMYQELWYQLCFPKSLFVDLVVLLIINMSSCWCLLDVANSVFFLDMFYISNFFSMSYNDFLLYLSILLFWILMVFMIIMVWMMSFFF